MINIQPPNLPLNWQSILGVLLLIAFLTFLAWGIWWFWRARRWIQRDPPELLLIDEVLKSLHRYLGKAGYDWLSACWHE